MSKRITAMLGMGGNDERKSQSEVEQEMWAQAEEEKMRMNLQGRLMLACKNGQLQEGLQVLNEMESYVRDKRRMKRVVAKLGHAVVGGRSKKFTL
jgi:hypothetical protein